MSTHATKQNLYPVPQETKVSNHSALQLLSEHWTQTTNILQLRLKHPIKIDHLELYSTPSTNSPMCQMVQWMRLILLNAL